MAIHDSDLSSQPSAVIKNTTDETIEVRTYDAFDNVQLKSESYVSIRPHEEGTVFGAEGAYHAHFYAYVYLGNKRTAWPGYMVQPGNVYEVHSSESKEPTLKFSFAPSLNRSDVILSPLQEAKRRCIIAGQDLLTIRENSTISGIESLLVALNKRYISVGVGKTTSSAGAIAGAAMVFCPVTMPAGLCVLASSSLVGVLSSSANDRGSSAEAMNFQQLLAEDMAATERFCEALAEYDKTMVWSVASGRAGLGVTEATVLALQGSTRIGWTAFGAAIAARVAARQVVARVPGAGTLFMIADTAHSWATGKVNEEKFKEVITELKASNEMISQVLDSLQLMNPDEGNSNAVVSDDNVIWPSLSFCCFFLVLVGFLAFAGLYFLIFLFEQAKWVFTICTGALILIPVARLGEYCHHCFLLVGVHVLGPA